MVIVENQMFCVEDTGDCEDKYPTTGEGRRNSSFQDDQSASCEDSARTIVPHTYQQKRCFLSFGAEITWYVHALLPSSKMA